MLPFKRELVTALLLPDNEFIIIMLPTPERLFGPFIIDDEELTLLPATFDMLLDILIIFAWLTPTPPPPPPPPPPPIRLDGGQLLPVTSE